jgi:hypothetical protein
MLEQLRSGTSDIHLGTFGHGIPKLSTKHQRNGKDKAPTCVSKVRCIKRLAGLVVGYKDVHSVTITKAGTSPFVVVTKVSGEIVVNFAPHVTHQ